MHFLRKILFGNYESKFLFTYIYPLLRSFVIIYLQTIYFLKNAFKQVKNVWLFLMSYVWSKLIFIMSLLIRLCYRFYYFWYCLYLFCLNVSMFSVLYQREVQYFNEWVFVGYQCIQSIKLGSLGLTLTEYILKVIVHLEMSWILLFFFLRGTFLKGVQYFYLRCKVLITEAGFFFVYLYQKFCVWLVDNIIWSFYYFNQTVVVFFFQILQEQIYRIVWSLNLAKLRKYLISVRFTGNFFYWLYSLSRGVTVYTFNVRFFYQEILDLYYGEFYANLFKFSIEETGVVGNEKGEGMLFFETLFILSQFNLIFPEEIENLNNPDESEEYRSEQLYFELVRYENLKKKKDLIDRYIFKQEFLGTLFTLNLFGIKHELKKVRKNKNRSTKKITKSDFQQIEEFYLKQILTYWNIDVAETINFFDDKRQLNEIFNTIVDRTKEVIGKQFEAKKRLALVGEEKQLFLHDSVIGISEDEKTNFIKKQNSVQGMFQSTVKVEDWESKTKIIKKLVQDFSVSFEEKISYCLELLFKNNLILKKIFLTDFSHFEKLTLRECLEDQMELTQLINETYLNLSVLSNVSKVKDFKTSIHGLVDNHTQLEKVERNSFYWKSKQINEALNPVLSFDVFNHFSKQEVQILVNSIKKKKLLNKVINFESSFDILETINLYLRGQRLVVGLSFHEQRVIENILILFGENKTKIFQFLGDLERLTLNEKRYICQMFVCIQSFYFLFKSNTFFNIGLGSICSDFSLIINGLEGSKRYRNLFKRLIFISQNRTSRLQDLKSLGTLLDFCNFLDLKESTCMGNDLDKRSRNKGSWVALQSFWREAEDKEIAADVVTGTHFNHVLLDLVLKNDKTALVKENKDSKYLFWTPTRFNDLLKHYKAQLPVLISNDNGLVGVESFNIGQYFFTGNLIDIQATFQKFLQEQKEGIPSMENIDLGSVFVPELDLMLTGAGGNVAMVPSSLVTVKDITVDYDKLDDLCLFLGLNQRTLNKGLVGNVKNGSKDLQTLFYANIIENSGGCFLSQKLGFFRVGLQRFFTYCISTYPLKSSFNLHLLFGSLPVGYTLPIRNWLIIEFFVWKSTKMGNSEVDLSLPVLNNLLINLSEDEITFLEELELSLCIDQKKPTNVKKDSFLNKQRYLVPEVLVNRENRNKRLQIQLQSIYQEMLRYSYEEIEEVPEIAALIKIFQVVLSGLEDDTILVEEIYQNLIRNSQVVSSKMEFGAESELLNNTSILKLINLTNENSALGWERSKGIGGLTKKNNLFVTYLKELYRVSLNDFIQNQNYGVLDYLVGQPLPNVWHYNFLKNLSGDDAVDITKRETLNQIEAELAGVQQSLPFNGQNYRATELMHRVQNYQDWVTSFCSHSFNFDLHWKFYEVSLFQTGTPFFNSKVVNYSSTGVRVNNNSKLQHIFYLNQELAGISNLLNDFFFSKRFNKVGKHNLGEMIMEVWGKEFCSTKKLSEILKVSSVLGSLIHENFLYVNSSILLYLEDILYTVSEKSGFQIEQTLAQFDEKGYHWIIEQDSRQEGVVPLIEFWVGFNMLYNKTLLKISLDKFFKYVNQEKMLFTSGSWKAYGKSLIGYGKVWIKTWWIFLKQLDWKSFVLFFRSVLKSNRDQTDGLKELDILNPEELDFNKNVLEVSNKSHTTNFFGFEGMNAIDLEKLLQLPSSWEGSTNNRYFMSSGILRPLGALRNPSESVTRFLTIEEIWSSLQRDAVFEHFDIFLFEDALDQMEINSLVFMTLTDLNRSLEAYYAEDYAFEQDKELTDWAVSRDIVFLVIQKLMPTFYQNWIKRPLVPHVVEFYPWFFFYQNTVALSLEGWRTKFDDFEEELIEDESLFVFLFYFLLLGLGLFPSYFDHYSLVLPFDDFLHVWNNLVFYWYKVFLPPFYNVFWYGWAFVSLYIFGLIYLNTFIISILESGKLNTSLNTYERLIFDEDELAPMVRWQIYNNGSETGPYYEMEPGANRVLNYFYKVPGSTKFIRLSKKLNLKLIKFLDLQFGFILDFQVFGEFYVLIVFLAFFRLSFELMLSGFTVGVKGLASNTRHRYIRTQYPDKYTFLPIKRGKHSKAEVKEMSWVDSSFAIFKFIFFGGTYRGGNRLFFYRWQHFLKDKSSNAISPISPSRFYNKRLSRPYMYDAWFFELFGSSIFLKNHIARSHYYEFDVNANWHKWSQLVFWEYKRSYSSLLSNFVLKNRKEVGDQQSLKNYKDISSYLQKTYDILDSKVDQEGKYMFGAEAWSRKNFKKVLKNRYECVLDHMLNEEINNWVSHQAFISLYYPNLNPSKRNRLSSPLAQLFANVRNYSLKNKESAKKISGLRLDLTERVDSYVTFEEGLTALGKYLDVKSIKSTGGLFGDKGIINLPSLVVNLHTLSEDDPEIGQFWSDLLSGEEYTRLLNYPRRGDFGPTFWGLNFLNEYQVRGVNTLTKVTSMFPELSYFDYDLRINFLDYDMRCYGIPQLLARQKKEVIRAPDETFFCPNLVGRPFKLRNPANWDKRQMKGFYGFKDLKEKYVNSIQSQQQISKLYKGSNNNADNGLSWKPNFSWKKDTQFIKNVFEPNGVGRQGAEVIMNPFHQEKKSNFRDYDETHGWALNPVMFRSFPPTVWKIPVLYDGPIQNKQQLVTDTRTQFRLTGQSTYQLNKELLENLKEAVRPVLQKLALNDSTNTYWFNNYWLKKSKAWNRYSQLKEWHSDSLGGWLNFKNDGFTQLEWDLNGFHTEYSVEKTKVYSELHNIMSFWDKWYEAPLSLINWLEWWLFGLSNYYLQDIGDVSVEDDIDSEEDFFRFGRSHSVIEPPVEHLHERWRLLSDDQKMDLKEEEIYLLNEYLGALNFGGNTVLEHEWWVNRKTNNHFYSLDKGVFKKHEKIYYSWSDYLKVWDRIYGLKEQGKAARAVRFFGAMQKNKLYQWYGVGLKENGLEFCEGLVARSGLGHGRSFDEYHRRLMFATQLKYRLSAPAYLYTNGSRIRESLPFLQNNLPYDTPYGKNVEGNFPSYFIQNKKVVSNLNNTSGVLGDQVLAIPKRSWWLSKVWGSYWDKSVVRHFISSSWNKQWLWNNFYENIGSDKVNYDNFKNLVNYKYQTDSMSLHDTYFGSAEFLRDYQFTRMNVAGERLTLQRGLEILNYLETRSILMRDSGLLPMLSFWKHRSLQRSNLFSHPILNKNPLKSFTYWWQGVKYELPFNLVVCLRNISNITQYWRNSLHKNIYLLNKTEFYQLMVGLEINAVAQRDYKQDFFKSYFNRVGYLKPVGPSNEVLDMCDSAGSLLMTSKGGSNVNLLPTLVDYVYFVWSKLTSFLTTFEELKVYKESPNVLGKGCEMRQLVNFDSLISVQGTRAHFWNDYSYTTETTTGMLKGLNFFEVVLSKNGIQRDYVGNNSFFTQSDAPLDYQIGFQDPGVPQMEGILNFHHDLFFFLIVILGVVLWLLFRIITTYSDYLKGRKKITHKESVTIEIIWTVIPGFILVLIIVPSFALLYSMDEIFLPFLTLKVIGVQWFWRYEYYNSTSWKINMNTDQFLIATEKNLISRFKGDDVGGVAASSLDDWDFSPVILSELEASSVTFESPVALFQSTREHLSYLFQEWVEAKKGHFLYEASFRQKVIMSPVLHSGLSLEIREILLEPSIFNYLSNENNKFLMRSIFSKTVELKTNGEVVSLLDLVNCYCVDRYTEVSSVLFPTNPLLASPFFAETEIQILKSLQKNGFTPLDNYYILSFLDAWGLEEEVTKLEVEKMFRPFNYFQWFKNSYGVWQADVIKSLNLVFSHFSLFGVEEGLFKTKFEYAIFCYVFYLAISDYYCQFFNVPLKQFREDLLDGKLNFEDVVQRLILSSNSGDKKFLRGQFWFWTHFQLRLGIVEQYFGSILPKTSDLGKSLVYIKGQILLKYTEADSGTYLSSYESYNKLLQDTLNVGEITDSVFLAEYVFHEMDQLIWVATQTLEVDSGIFAHSGYHEDYLEEDNLSLYKQNVNFQWVKQIQEKIKLRLWASMSQVGDLGSWFGFCIGGSQKLLNMIDTYPQTFFLRFFCSRLPPFTVKPTTKEFFAELPIAHQEILYTKEILRTTFLDRYINRLVFRHAFMSEIESFRKFAKNLDNKLAAEKVSRSTNKNTSSDFHRRVVLSREWQQTWEERIVGTDANSLNHLIGTNRIVVNNMEDGFIKTFFTRIFEKLEFFIQNFAFIKMFFILCWECASISVFMHMYKNACKRHYRNFCEWTHAGLIGRSSMYRFYLFTSRSDLKWLMDYYGVDLFPLLEQGVHVYKMDKLKLTYRLSDIEYREKEALLSLINPTFTGEHWIFRHLQYWIIHEHILENYHYIYPKFFDETQIMALLNRLEGFNSRIRQIYHLYPNFFSDLENPRTVWGPIFHALYRDIAQNLRSYQGQKDFDRNWMDADVSVNELNNSWRYLLYIPFMRSVKNWYFESRLKRDVILRKLWEKETAVRWNEELNLKFLGRFIYDPLSNELRLTDSLKAFKEGSTAAQRPRQVFIYNEKLLERCDRWHSKIVSQLDLTQGRFKNKNMFKRSKSRRLQNVILPVSLSVESLGVDPKFKIRTNRPFESSASKSTRWDESVGSKKSRVNPTVILPRIPEQCEMINRVPTFFEVLTVKWFRAKYHIKILNQYFHFVRVGKNYELPKKRRRKALRHARLLWERYQLLNWSLNVKYIDKLNIRLDSLLHKLNAVYFRTTFTEARRVKKQIRVPLRTPVKNKINRVWSANIHDQIINPNSYNYTLMGSDRVKNDISESSFRLIYSFYNRIQLYWSLTGMVLFYYCREIIKWFQFYEVMNAEYEMNSYLRFYDIDLYSDLDWDVRTGPINRFSYLRLMEWKQVYGNEIEQVGYSMEDEEYRSLLKLIFYYCAGSFPKTVTFILDGFAVCGLIWNFFNRLCVVGLHGFMWCIYGPSLLFDLFSQTFKKVGFLSKILYWKLNVCCYHLLYLLSGNILKNRMYYDEVRSKLSAIIFLDQLTANFKKLNYGHADSCHLEQYLYEQYVSFLQDTTTEKNLRSIKPYKFDNRFAENISEKRQSVHILLHFNKAFEKFFRLEYDKLRPQEKQLVIKNIQLLSETHDIRQLIYPVLPALYFFHISWIKWLSVAQGRIQMLFREFVLANTLITKPSVVDQDSNFNLHSSLWFRLKGYSEPKAVNLLIPHFRDNILLKELIYAVTTLEIRNQVLLANLTTVLKNNILGEIKAHKSGAALNFGSRQNRIPTVEEIIVSPSSLLNLLGNINLKVSTEVFNELKFVKLVQKWKELEWKDMGFTAHNFYLKLLLKQSGLVSTKSVSALRIHQLKNNFHSNRNRIAEFLTYNLKQSTRYAFTEMEYLYVENLYKEFSLRYLDERELFLKNALMFNHVTGSNFFDIEGLAVKDIASYGMYLKEDHDLKLFEQGRSSTTESFTPVIEDILLYQTGSNCFNGISLEETVVTEKFNNFIKEEQNHLVIAFQPLEQFTSSVQSNILNGNSSVFESYEEYLTSQLIGSCGFLYQLIDYVRERPTVFESRLVPLEELEIGMFRLLETDRRVVMPILRTIRYTITSQDVLHSFALPSAATKMDACPGRLNEVSLFVKRSGVMYGQCSEICGVGHGFMPIAVRNVDSEIFSSWLLFNNYKGRLMVHGIGLATRKRLQLMFGM